MASTTAPSASNKSIQVLKKFFRDQTGWTMLFILSHVLFWVYGYPDLKEYGYRMDKQDPHRGNYYGPQGSGVVPITLVIVIIFSGIWFMKVFCAFREALPAEKKS